MRESIIFSLNHDRVLFFVILINFNFVLAQKINDSTYVKFTNQKIVIDGIDNETDWKKAEIKSNFWQWFPTDSLKALKQTEIRFL